MTTGVLGSVTKLTRLMTAKLLSVPEEEVVPTVLVLVRALPP